MLGKIGHNLQDDVGLMQNAEKKHHFNTSLDWEAMLVLVGTAEVGDLSRDVRRGEMPVTTVLVGDKNTSIFRGLSVELLLDWVELSTFTF